MVHEGLLEPTESKDAYKVSKPCVSMLFGASTVKACTKTGLQTVNVAVC